MINFFESKSNIAISGYFISSCISYASFLINWLAKAVKTLPCDTIPIFLLPVSIFRISSIAAAKRERDSSKLSPLLKVDFLSE